MRSLDMGLFTGRTGVATVLYELGYKKEAHEIISTIDIESVEMNNISIMSGLAGIGLAFVSLSVDEMFSDLLGKAILIGEKLLEAAQRDVKIFKIDEDFISMGLIDGWAGVSLFFNALYRATQNDVWLNASVTILQKDINNCVRDEDGLLQADDTTRVLPYIAGGSAGIALVIDQIRDIVEPHKFDKDLEDILKLHNTQVCYNGGLFRGYGSFIMLDNLLHCYKPETPDMTDKILNRLNNYTVEDERNLYMVGDYGRRISHDIFTGSAGVLLALSDVGRGRYMSWFPIPQCPYLRT
jgi:non-specific serine/threonine protein kinase